jgi:hypothetical protein
MLARAVTLSTHALNELINPPQGILKSLPNVRNLTHTLRKPLSLMKIKGGERNPQQISIN